MNYTRSTTNLNEYQRLQKIRNGKYLLQAFPLHSQRCRLDTFGINLYTNYNRSNFI